MLLFNDTDFKLGIEECIILCGVILCHFVLLHYTEWPTAVRNQLTGSGNC